MKFIAMALALLVLAEKTTSSLWVDRQNREHWLAGAIACPAFR